MGAQSEKDPDQQSPRWNLSITPLQGASLTSLHSCGWLTSLSSYIMWYVFFFVFYGTLTKTFWFLKSILRYRNIEKFHSEPLDTATYSLKYWATPILRLHSSSHAGNSKPFWFFSESVETESIFTQQILNNSLETFRHVQILHSCLQTSRNWVLIVKWWLAGTSCRNVQARLLVDLEIMNIDIPGVLLAVGQDYLQLEST